jgi:protease-4
MLFFGKKRKELYLDDVLETEMKVYKTKLWSARLGLIMTILLFFLFLFLFWGVAGKFFRNSLGIPILHRPYVAVVNLDKIITIDYANRLMSALDRLKGDSRCKGVLVIFNTPGGSPAGSEELSSYFREFQKSKPVIGYVEGMAASGGYYIASALHPLTANRNAVVGSIGVILPRLVVGKLANRVGVERDDIYVGKYKELGNWFKKLNPQEKKYLKEALLQPTYQNFLKAVALNRKMKLEKVKEYADGKVYLASKVEKILVDKITTLTELKKELRQKFGSKVRFYTLRFSTPSTFPLHIQLELGSQKLFQQGAIGATSYIGK